MAKRGSASAARNVTAKAAGQTGPAAPGESADATIERRLIEFAEQLGHFAGNLQSKADHLLDGEALAAQMATVRASAAELLTHLAAGAKQASASAARVVARTPRPGVAGKKKVVTAAKGAAKKASPAGGTSKGRSGGVVDAPGKKHRKPLPKDPQASQARSQTAKLREVMPMAKTPRHRGRG
jgi:hypothetical protein